ncbi:DUF2946 domain-containing protein [Yersinia mollaretii]|uniref:DUF2946 domain-containing protein n=1 Tax=Yersinia mollaretii TaxID=33060 RepID=UPI0009BC3D47|nr:DUF2946 domain-containing protein [Yersinia mollaretii]MDA5528152.1 DUF2946 domain-containing protein [Yersinia mollaretii]MDA5536259.1 DUF2946 domain-containing protein [Yersinia mollaretii]MDR7873708.1 DUF2946 domain-containing protein [Yersinia mollaretii]NIL04825.1 DUF2946 domain-containing protein [Yersinia mollaretii]PHZ30540.1 DUF2946 domain-containing protein [Yersinia mollaretii]
MDDRRSALVSRVPLSQVIYQGRRYSAWLGIVAILMLFIAPVVSVSLALTYEKNTPAIMMMADDTMEMASHHGSGPEAHHGAKTADSAEHGNHHDSMMMDHAACGYCVLLTHLPLLNTAFKADIRSALLLAELSPPLFIYPQVIKDHYSESQPRAPPTVYS